MQPATANAPCARGTEERATDVKTPPRRSLFWRVFPSVMLPMFLAVADQTIVATALPAMAEKLGTIERAPWVVLSYLIASTIAAPVYGRLGDVFGRRHMMVVALAAFMLASVLCALSSSIEMLSAMRVLQGFGGGGLMTLSQALVGEAVPPRERGRYQGYLAAVAVSSSTFGPFAGGYLTQYLGWQSIFLLNVPIGLGAVLLVLRLPSNIGRITMPPFDVSGLALFAAFVASSVLALEQLQRLDARAVPTAILLAAAATASAVGLWRHERCVSFPLLPVSLLREPSVWRSDALAACHGAALVSLLTFLPIYFRVAGSTGPAQTGLLLLPLTFGIGMGSLITGRLISKTGYTTVIPFYGLMVATSILLFLALWAPHIDVKELPWIFGVNALFMGTVMGVVQVTVQTASGPKMLGAGAATVQFSRSVGAAVGTAAVAAVLFGALAATDTSAASRLGSIFAGGGNATATLEPAHAAIERDEVVTAFRAAFATIAAFTGMGVWLARSIPIRRV